MIANNLFQLVITRVIELEQVIKNRMICRPMLQNKYMHIKASF